MTHLKLLSVLGMFLVLPTAAFAKSQVICGSNQTDLNQQIEQAESAGYTTVSAPSVTAAVSGETINSRIINKVCVTVSKSVHR